MSIDAKGEIEKNWKKTKMYHEGKARRRRQRGATKKEEETARKRTTKWNKHEKEGAGRLRNEAEHSGKKESKERPG